MAKLNIAFISFSFVAGGAERNIINLVTYFKKTRIHADILLFKPVDDYIQEYKAYPDFFRIYTGISERKHVPFWLKPLKGLVLLVKFIRIIKENNYKVLLGAQEYSPFYITVFLAQLLHIKSILIVGNNIREEIARKSIFTRYIYYFLFYISLRFCTKVVCVSDGLKTDTANYFHINTYKIERIYNGVDIAYINRLSNLKTNLSKSKKLTFICLGRLVSKKGHLPLLNLFQSMIKSNPKIQLLILGKGDQEKTIFLKIKRLGIKNNVKLIGFAKNPYQFLRMSDIFIFSSEFEGFGNVIIEAMACSKPIISVDCDYGPREILRKKTKIDFNIFECHEGLLIPPLKGKSTNELTAISSIILKKIEDNTLRKSYAKNALIRAHHFNDAAMGLGYKNMIQKIIK